MAPDSRADSRGRASATEKKRDSSRDRSHRDKPLKDDRDHRDSRQKSRTPPRGRDGRDWHREPSNADRHHSGHSLASSRSPSSSGRPLPGPPRPKSDRSLPDGRQSNGQQLPPPPPLPHDKRAPEKSLSANNYGNSLHLMLKETALKAALNAKRDRQDDPSGLTDSAKKTKHSPIVWRTPPKKPGAEPESAQDIPRAASSSALSRAEQEILEFKKRQRQEFGYDPDAPPALKASPSVSAASSEEEGRYHQSPDGRSQRTPPSTAKKQSPGRYRDDLDDEEEDKPDSAPAKPGLSSRWLSDLGDNEDEPSNANVKRQKTDVEGQGSEDGERIDEPSQRGPAVSGVEAASMRSPTSMAVTTQADGAAGSGADDGNTSDEEGARAAFMLECRSVEEYERVNRVSEGTYGVVYRAREKSTSKIYALKKIKMEKEKDGFPQTSIREINIMLALNHPNIVNVTEVVVGRSLDSVFMAMEFMEHDLKYIMEKEMKQPFSQAEVKCLMQQLLKGVKYLHDNWVLHRDLKTSNLLYNNKGELKICDFGLARQYGSPLKQYTTNVVTLWYRPPELLMGQTKYDTKLDMWSVGCIMAELLSRKPLFDGQHELEQLDKIFKVLGTPNEDNWPGWSKLPGPNRLPRPVFKHYPNVLRERFPKAVIAAAGPILSDEGFDLLCGLLAYNPEKRLSAGEALAHPWFSERPLPQAMELMPTFPARKHANAMSRFGAPKA